MLKGNSFQLVKLLIYSLLGYCHATTGPPKIGPPGPVAATILGPPGLLAVLQLVSPGQLTPPQLVPPLP